MSSQSADVVGDLLDLEDGDVVTLESSSYEWANPFEVVVEQDVVFEAPTGNSWTARCIRFESESPRGSDRKLRAVEGLGAPHFGRGYGPLVCVEPVGHRDRRNSESCEWLERAADEIVEDSPISRDLEEVLRAAERADGWLQVHKRLAAGTVSRTKGLLWELGLRKENGELLDGPERQNRIDELREVYLDE